ncbi:MAG: hypothetical protein R3B72_27375 [Polyangiaceae bacterium]
MLVLAFYPAACTVFGVGDEGGDARGDAAGGDGEGGDGGGEGGHGVGGAGEGGSGQSEIVACSEATVFSGVPTFSGDLIGQDPHGHPINAEPPLLFHDIAFQGDTLGVATQAELWSLDTSAPEPEYVRIAGENGTFGFQPGACSQARFANAHGLAALPDGDWLVADYVGNNILLVTAPGAAECEVKVVAGNAESFSGVETTPHLPGDQDGVGAVAKLNGPRDLTTDMAGNAFFVDVGNKKLKKLHAPVPNDEGRLVTTLATLATADYTASQLSLNATTVLDDYVYLAGSTTTSHDIVVRVPTGGGDVEVIYDTFEELDGVAGTAANWNAMSHDGTALLIAGAAGRIWRMTTDGEVQPYLAGGGKVPGLNPDNYDFTLPFPAKDAPMQSQSTVSDTMAIHDGSIFIPSVANGTGFWLWQFRCD